MHLVPCVLDELTKDMQTIPVQRNCVKEAVSKGKLCRVLSALPRSNHHGHDAVEAALCARRIILQPRQAVFEEEEPRISMAALVVPGSVLLPRLFLAASFTSM